MTTESVGHHQNYHALHRDPTSATLALKADEERELAALKRQRRREERAWVFGRVALGVVFLIAAAVKAFTFNSVSALIEARGFAGPDALLTFAITIEVVGGLMVLAGFQARRAAVGLIGWLLLVTVLVHGDLSEPINRAFALSNLAFAAGLLLLAAHGAGVASVDHARHRRQAQATNS